MRSYATPGVHFEVVDPARQGLAPVRMDIAGFAGYARKGPLHTPVRIVSWRQFLTEFGAPLPFGYLADAVRGFFANGGAVCHVVRVAAEQDARNAVGSLPASGTGREWRVTASSPGVWGNELAVAVRRVSRGATLTVGDPLPDSIRTGVESLTGFERGSLVALRQGDVTGHAVVKAVDSLRSSLEWTEPLPGEFDLGRSIRLESMEFSLLVFEADLVQERYPFLSVVPSHRLYAPDVLNHSSRLIRLQTAIVGEQPVSPFEQWLPASTERLRLAEGRDGLQAVTIDDLTGLLSDPVPRGIGSLELTTDVGILACCDLMARPVPQPRSRNVVRPPIVDCSLPPLPTPARVRGLVQDAFTRDPIAGVTVSLVGIGDVETADDGTFAFDDVPPGPIEVALSAERYIERSLSEQAIANETLQLTDRGEDGLPLDALLMTPIEQPSAWTIDEILDAQQRMIGQCERKRDRVAILDSPFVTDVGTPFGLDQVRSWRSRFDTAFAALYFPWLRTRVDDLAVQSSRTIRDIPPSGYVAGVYARTELRDGVHRAPANEHIVGVDGVTFDIDDTQHGVLNDEHINVIRPYPGRGVRIFGARTLSSDSQWRFINVRRLISMIEASLIRDTQWAVFESHTDDLRRGLSLGIFAFLEELWQRGALTGDTREGAFAIRSDAVNNPPDVVDAGRVICDVAVAPSLPFEFIVFRLGRTVEAVEIVER